MPKRIAAPIEMYNIFATLRSSVRLWPTVAETGLVMEILRSTAVLRLQMSYPNELNPIAFHLAVMSQSTHLWVTKPHFQNQRFTQIGAPCAENPAMAIFVPQAVAGARSVSQLAVLVPPFGPL